MFAVHANPRKPRTFIPSKYTRYTVYSKKEIPEEVEEVNPEIHLWYQMVNESNSKHSRQPVSPLPTYQSPNHTTWLGLVG